MKYSEVVDKVLSVKPKDRVREPSGDDFYDEAVGILLGFKAILESRNGHVDLITVKYAVEEMRELATSYASQERWSRSTESDMDNASCDPVITERE